MATKAKVKVVYFTRKQRPLGNFSLEIYFEQVRKNLPAPFHGILCEMPYESNGLIKRVANAFYCIFKQGDVNHVTGDIHYVAVFLKKQKTILTILDCGMLHDTKGLKHQILKFFWFTLPIQCVAIVTAISQATKDDIIYFTQCDAKKIQVVYVCIDPIFKRSDSGFNTSKPRILQIGTAHNKNLHRLIPALGEVSCTLIVIGKMNNVLLDLLEENKIDYEMIDRKITNDEIFDHYKKCDIVSFVSTLEGFGMPIVEANTIGRVVHTGNTTSMPEIAGNAAHVVDPYKIEEIRDGFLKIIGDSNYRNRLIDNGFENTKRFNPKTIAVDFAKVYSKMICIPFKEDLIKT